MPSAKHFINDGEEVVRQHLEALTLFNPNVCNLKADKAVVSKLHDTDRCVATMSGGGAGHEPAHAGFVGRNLLTAAISGNIFASPSVSQIYNTVMRVSAEAGTLLIVKNYTGDVLNFNLAASKANAAGIPTRVVIVGDDVSVGRAKSGKVGRRGLAGTVLVHKIVSGFANATSDPPSLEEVTALAQQVADSLVTVGASLDHVHVPGRATDNSGLLLGHDELELGMGIHNEPGCRLVSPLPDISALVKEMLLQLLDTKDTDRAYVDFSGDRANIALLINNLGGTSMLELGGISNEVFKQLDDTYAINPLRSYIGTFMSSLDGPGFSITLLKLANNMTAFLDCDVEAVGWPVQRISAEATGGRTFTEQDLPMADLDSPGKTASGSLTVSTKAFKASISSACTSLIDAEPSITIYDTKAGDGDCGTTLKRGATAVLSFVSNISSADIDVVSSLRSLAGVIEQNMDGTSGIIISIFVNALVAGLSEQCNSEIPSVLTTQHMTKAAARALRVLEQATPARPGDRTLMDALTPFVVQLQATGNVFEASRAARVGADATKGMTPSLGRSVYVNADVYGEVPDAGAVGIAEFVEGLAKAFEP